MIHQRRRVQLADAASPSFAARRSTPPPPRRRTCCPRSTRRPSSAPPPPSKSATWSPLLLPRPPASPRRTSRWRKLSTSPSPTRPTPSLRLPLRPPLPPPSPLPSSSPRVTPNSTSSSPSAFSPLLLSPLRPASSVLTLRRRARRARRTCASPIRSSFPRRSTSSISRAC